MLWGSTGLPLTAFLWSSNIYWRQGGGDGSCVSGGGSGGVCVEQEMLVTNIKNALLFL